MLKRDSKTGYFDALIIIIRLTKLCKSTQTKPEMEHRMRKLDTISERKHNSNKSAGPKHNRKSM